MVLNNPPQILGQKRSIQTWNGKLWSMYKTSKFPLDNITR